MMFSNEEEAQGKEGRLTERNFIKCATAGYVVENMLAPAKYRAIKSKGKRLLERRYADIL